MRKGFLAAVLLLSLSGSALADQCDLPVLNFQQEKVVSALGAGLDHTVMEQALSGCEKQGEAECTFRLVRAAEMNFVKHGVNYETTFFAVMANPYTRNAALKSGVFSQYLALLSLPTLKGGTDVLFKHMMAGEISEDAVHTAVYWSEQPEIQKIFASLG